MDCFFTWVVNHNLSVRVLKAALGGILSRETPVHVIYVALRIASKPCDTETRVLH